MNKKRSLQKKADRLLQEEGRRRYEYCLVCGKPMSCLHHYYPKSMASALRYDWDNLIPICVGDHFRHHNGDPRIHNKVNEVKGEEWLNRLKSKKEEIVKTSIPYYEKVIEDLTCG